MTVARRQFLQSAAASVAVAVPAMPPGCIMSPAAASILKAAPYVPAQDDAELLRLASRFQAVASEQSTAWAVFCDANPSKEACADVEPYFAGLFAEWVGTSDTCYGIAPTTPAGASALLKVILERDADFIDDEPKEALRRLSDALAAMVRA